MSTGKRTRTTDSNTTNWRLGRTEQVLLVIAVIVVCVAMWLGGARAASAHDTATVRVRAGETLWTLAHRHAVDGQSTEQTAQLIADLNGLQGGELRQGQEIKVPRAATLDTAMASAR